MGKSTAGKLFTLITGGSEGIGRAMAVECAQRGQNIAIVALENPHLEETAEMLRTTYKVEVKTLGIDLAEEHAPQKVHEWAAAEGLSVNVLINNAGFGRSGLYRRHTLETYNTMVHLNNRAMVGMVYHFLPDLKKHKKAWILNMGSGESTMPLPYKAVYSGSKHFIFGFSLSLRKELEDDNISVTIITPGPTVTNEDGLKRIRDAGLGGRIVVNTAEGVAKKAIKALFKGKMVVPTGNLIGPLMWLARHLPHGLRMRLLKSSAKDFKNH